jgi:hypothetical protein
LEVGPAVVQYEKDYGAASMRKWENGRSEDEKVRRSAKEESKLVSLNVKMTIIRLTCHAAIMISVIE